MKAGCLRASGVPCGFSDAAVARDAPGCVSTLRNKRTRALRHALSEECTGGGGATIIVPEEWAIGPRCPAHDNSLDGRKA
mmetsp:Transcript_92951/g.262493  ORF Transcript_92951/g.262493 Transcript_92951/m.262493 type:complete len:80 (+) Transcript_92951:307-546(+)